MTKNQVTFLLLSTILLVSVAAFDSQQKLEDLIRPHIDPVEMREVHDIDEVEFFSVIGHARSAITGMGSSITEFACKSCQGTFNYLLGMNTNVLNTIGTFIAEEACIIKAWEDYTVCKAAASQMAPIIVDSLFKHYADPDFLCPMIKLCPAAYHNLDIQAFINATIFDKPVKADPVPTRNATFRVAQITDVHVDFEYTSGTEVKCNEPICCQAKDGQAKSAETSAGYWGALGNCDLPPHTALQGFDFLQTLNPDMILWTGDSSSHAYWKTTQQQNINSSLWVSQELKKRFNSSEVPVFPIDGSQECYPMNTFDYNSDKEDALRNAFSEDWKEWIGEEAAAQVKKNVFYSTYYEKFNIRMIAIDTNTCQDTNLFLLENPTDPAGMLAWLKNELQEAEDKGQFAYIIGHVPVGSCMYEWAKRYGALVDRYSFTIRGQFFGHTHNDLFQVFYANGTTKPVGTQFIAPSLSTYNKKNPSIRIFEVDVDTGIPLKIRQYRLNLTNYNGLGAVDKLVWDEVYDTETAYNLTDLTPASMDQLRTQTLNDKEIGQKVSDNSATTHQKYFVPKYLYCLMLPTDREQRSCYSGMPLANVDISWPERLAGPWFERIKKAITEND